MVAIKLKWRGSYTVEGTLVVSLACIMIALTVMLGFYGHDRSIMKSTANELAVMAGLWDGRYLSPETCEVDYEALKNCTDLDLRIIEDLGYQWIQKRLLYGTVQSVRATNLFLRKDVQIEIITVFKIWNYEFEYKVQASSPVFESEDLPRMFSENGEEK